MRAFYVCVVSKPNQEKMPSHDKDGEDKMG